MIHCETEFPVRYYETDQMGIVHHSNYVRYFECARNVLLNEIGYPIEVCEQEGVMIPIVSLECRYRYSAKMGDTVRAVAEVESVPMAKLYIRQAVYNQNGELCAEGSVVLGFIDSITRRPVRCPEKLVKLISETLEKNQ